MKKFIWKHFGCFSKTSQKEQKVREIQIPLNQNYVVDIDHNLPTFESYAQESIDGSVVPTNNLIRDRNTQSSEVKSSNQQFSSEKISNIEIEIHQTVHDETENEKHKLMEEKHSEISIMNQVSSECEQRRGLESFYHQLDEIIIQWPGDSQVKFSDNNSLKRFLEYQYPDWKIPGNVTSIPCARIPKIFLRNVDLSKELQKHFKSLQKGDEGENKVYRTFVSQIQTDDGGIIVLPNVDGSHIFEKGGLGSVEIDMIVVHPTKGIFIFNIKNETGVSAKKLQNEMLKHTTFARHIMGYNILSHQPTTWAEKDNFELDAVPIYAVFFYIPGNLNATTKRALEDAKWYTEGSAQNIGIKDVLVFQKSDFQSFASKWKNELRKLSSMKSSAMLDVIAARLVALNSLEGASALVHQKLVSDELQSIHVNTKKAGVLRIRLEQQLDETFTPGEDEELKKEMIDFMEKTSSPPVRGKTRIVLWTKEQLNVLATVFRGLMQSSDEGMRIAVKGAKGSGKTMLMVYLARLAELVFKKQQNGGRVIICDGSRGWSKLLFSQLRLKLKGTGIELASDYKHVHEQLNDVTEKCIIFFDEAFLQFHSNYTTQLKKSVHYCVFSSDGRDNENSFGSLYLTQTLRSTSRLQIFFNNLLKNDSPSVIDMNGIISHGLTGTNRPDVVLCRASSHCDIESFWDKGCEIVMKYARVSTGMPEILVILEFLSPRSQINILFQLKKKELNLCSQSYNIEFKGETHHNLPTIRVEPSRTVAGTEFGCVIVFLEPIVNQTPRHFKSEFFMCATRATTSLAVVATDIAASNTALSENEMMDIMWHLYDFPCFRNKLKSYSLSQKIKQVKRIQKIKAVLFDSFFEAYKLL